MRPELDIFQFTLFIRQFGLDFKSSHFDPVLGFVLPWLPEVLVYYEILRSINVLKFSAQFNTD
jgi:hypothetical protein